ncbi:hypothetical protein BURK1_02521 [Burkholderiales bacterium]|nr:hypothetical protein BURK1_02521 [Burkholderiales bacterium]
MRDGVLVLLIAAFAVVATVLARSVPWAPGSDVGYALGVASGIALLGLFLYPLRKRWAPVRHWGASRGWFAAHMMLGIAAPLLVVLHSRLQLGSLNATVAFTCMVLVATSGVVGRFLYARIHAGLYGEETSLAALREEVARRIGALREGGGLGSELDARLAAFASLADRASEGGWRHLFRLARLGVDRTLAARACGALVASALAGGSRVTGGERRALKRRIAGKRALLGAYLRGVQRVAQFRAFQRLFSWWHVLHVPLVWMLVATTIAHVVAVHMY